MRESTSKSKLELRYNSIKFIMALALCLLCIGVNSRQAHAQPQNSELPQINESNALNQARTTFIKFRSLEERGEKEEIIKLYEQNAEIVLLDNNNKGLSLSPQDYNGLLKHIAPFQKTPEEENDKEINKEKEVGIFYDSPTFTESKKSKEPKTNVTKDTDVVDVTDVVEVRAIRKNASTKESHPIYLEISNSKITHHAWSPILEINPSAQKEEKLKSLLADFAFNKETNKQEQEIEEEQVQEREEDLPPISTNPRPPKTTPEQSQSSNQNSISALRIINLGSLDDIAQKLHKHLDRDSQKRKGKLEIISGSYGFNKQNLDYPIYQEPEDSENNYYLTMVETSYNQNPKQKDPTSTLVCSRLYKVPDTEDNIIAVTYKLPLTINEKKVIEGQEIATKRIIALEALSSLDPEEISFE